MKAEINEQGMLELFPENKTEEYALKMWRAEGSKVQTVSRDTATAKDVIEERQETTAQAHKTAQAITKTVTAALTPVHENDREAIKAALNALGAKYKPRAKTETLYSLLKVVQENKAAAAAAANAAEAVAEAVPAKPTVAPDAQALPVTEVDVPSVQDTIELVKKYAGIKGTDAAKKIILDNKVPNISAMTEVQRAATCVKIRKELGI